MYVDSPTVTLFGSCGLAVRQVHKVGGETNTRAFAYDFSGNKIRDFDSQNRVVTSTIN
jgi:hypothetical protein